MALDRVTTAEQVYEALLDELMCGRFQRSEKLQESGLAEYFQVSRTPLREALSKLQHDGLVVSEPYRGVFVRDYTQEEAEELVELRIELEVFAARLAALRHTPEEIREIRDALIHFEQTIGKEENILLRTKANADFHMAIARASHNRWLCQVLDRLQVHYSLLRSPALSDPERVRAIKGEHSSLAEAIADRHPEWAEERIRRHLESARDFLITHVFSSSWPRSR